MATSDYTISTLPANVEAERSILGAILLDNFAYNQAAEHLRIEDFSLDSHRRIYSRMVDLAESSRPIDMITLIEELERRKDLQPIGDVSRDVVVFNRFDNGDLFFGFGDDGFETEQVGRGVDRNDLEVIPGD